MVKSKKISPKKPKGSRGKSTLFADKDLLSLRAVGTGNLDEFFKLTAQVKKNPERFLGKLRGKTLGLLFQKPSNRTRIAFEVGMTQMGGAAVYLSESDILMGRREPMKDVARTFSRYFDGIVLRTYSHSDMEEFARHSQVPIINGLSDREHPSQVLADLFTIQSKLGKIKGVNITYIGDANNVLHSLLYGAAYTGANLMIVSPRGYEPSEDTMRDIKLLAKPSGAKIAVSNNPFASLKNAHIIYTDVWVSMGQERQHDQRLRDFPPFQVSQAIVSKALPDALVMHCMPAHRGEEITDEVLEGPHSIVFEQAENKLHAQKALLMYLLSKKKRNNK